MKKIIFAIAIVLTIGLSASAQGNDSFLAWEESWGNRGVDDFPLIPFAAMGINGNVNADPAPLGSGLLALTALGAGYAVAKKRKK